MLAVQIATGIILAVLALRFWRQALLLTAVGLVLVVLIVGGVWVYRVLRYEPNSKAADGILIAFVVAVATIGREVRAYRHRHPIKDHTTPSPP